MPQENSRSSRLLLCRSVPIGLRSTSTAVTRMPQKKAWERHILELSLQFVLSGAPGITTFQCWVTLASGNWDAIVSPFERQQPNILNKEQKRERECRISLTRLW